MQSLYLNFRQALSWAIHGGKPFSVKEVKVLRSRNFSAIRITKLFIGTKLCSFHRGRFGKVLLWEIITDCFTVILKTRKEFEPPIVFFTLEFDILR